MCSRACKPGSSPSRCGPGLPGPRRGAAARAPAPPRRSAAPSRAAACPAPRSPPPAHARTPAGQKRFDQRLTRLQPVKNAAERVPGGCRRDRGAEHRCAAGGGAGAMPFAHPLPRGREWVHEVGGGGGAGKLCVDCGGGILSWTSALARRWQCAEAQARGADDVCACVRAC